MQLKLTEKQIETQILIWLNAQPDTFAFKVNTVGIYDPVKKFYRKNWNRFVIKGTSDILGTFRGRFFAIEVKTHTAYMRIIKRSDFERLPQSLFLSKVQRCGGIGFYATSLDAVRVVFNGLRNLN